MLFVPASHWPMIEKAATSAADAVCLDLEDMFNGKAGRPAHGMGFGLIVQVVEDNVAAGLRVSNGSFGWDGAFGTQMWVQPKEKMVTLIMIQTQVPQAQRDFENAVMQAIVE